MNNNFYLTLKNSFKEYYMGSFREIILKIKARPSMYLGGNSISSLKAYLDGWYDRDREGVEDVELLNEFQDWIEERFSLKGSHSYDRIILFYSQDECSALTEFFKLFDMFLTGYPEETAR